MFQVLSPPAALWRCSDRREEVAGKGGVTLLTGTQAPHLWGAELSPAKNAFSQLCSLC